MSHINPKSELIAFLQRFCGKTLTKADVTWTSSGTKGAFQSILTLACLSNQEFAGEVCSTEKEAEQAAARVALEAFAAEIAALPPKQTKTKQKKSGSQLSDPADNLQHLQQLAGQNGNQNDEANNFKNKLIKALQAHCKRPMAKGDIVYEHNRIENMVQATARLDCVGGMAFAGEPAMTDKAAEQSAAQQALLANEAWGEPLAPAVTPPVQVTPPVAGNQTVPSHAGPKSELVMLLQGYLRKTMSKNDVSYNYTQQGGLTQAIVTIGPMDGQQFAGEPCSSQKDAENSAAQQAITAYASLAASNPAIAKIAQKRTALGMPAVVPPGAKRPRGAQPGTVGVIAPANQIGGAIRPPNAGGAVRPPKAGGSVRPPKAPAVATGPRTEVLAVPVTGEVTEWFGKQGFGYIKPHSPIGHPMESQKSGKIYVHKQDLSGVAVLTPGTNVQFTVYSDNKGLGCANVMEL